MAPTSVDTNGAMVAFLSPIISKTSAAPQELRPLAHFSGDFTGSSGRGRIGAAAGLGLLTGSSASG
jgi:hypothetical protein